MISFRQSKIQAVEKDKQDETTKQEESSMKVKNLYHRKDGRWEYKKQVNGQLVRFTVSTQAEGIARIRELKNTAKTKAQVDTSFEKWIDKWFTLYKEGNIANSTLLQYKRLVNKHIKPFFKNIPIKKITAEKVQQFINHMQTERVRDNAFITIKQILKYAYINKLISDNIAEMIVKPRKKVKPHKTALSLEEQERFLTVLKTYETDVQMFMIFSLVIGSRRSETLSFKFEDINKARNYVHIHGTKTALSDRKVKISDDMIALLEKNKQVADDQPYFKYVTDNYSKKAHDIYVQANIKGKTLHDLRHTCSTNLFYLGVPDKQRQQILGHASIVMTNDIYTNLQEDIDKDGLLKLYNNLYYKF